MTNLIVRDPSDGSVIERPPGNLAALSLGEAIKPEGAIKELDGLLEAVEKLPRLQKASTLEMYPHLRREIADASDTARQLKQSLAPEIGRLGCRLTDVIKSRSDNAMTRAMICLMVDSLPSAKNFEGRSYVDVCVWMLGTEPRNVTNQRPGFGPTLVACTIRDILRKATFAPPPADIVTGAHAQSARFMTAAWKARRALERINWVIDQSCI